MKVKELIEQLTKLDPELDVILQKDSEGNGYCTLAGVDADVVYDKDESGMAYSMDWTAEDADMTEKEWNKMKKKPRVVVLYP